MLWFKNVMIYRFNKDFSLTADEIAQRLDAFRFVACGSQESSRSGWIAPIGYDSDELTHVGANAILMTCRKEEKILPASVIKQALHAKIEKLETAQGRKLKKTEKETLKDEVMQTLLPRAFSRYTQTHILLDLSHDLIMVDAASSKRAEEVLALLRKSLGSLPVVPLAFPQPIEQTMTRWLQEGGSKLDFVIQDEAELTAMLSGGGIICCKEQDLTSEEVLAHLAQGKQVTKLALTWQDRLQFILVNDGSLKRLKFSDALRDQNADIAREDYRQRFDADFTLMVGEFSHLMQALITHLNQEQA